MKDKLIKERITELVKILGGNQSEFARKIGLKPNHLSMVISSGDTGVSANILLKLAEYGVNMNWLLIGKGTLWQKDQGVCAESEKKVAALKIELKEAKAVIKFTERILTSKKGAK